MEGILNILKPPGMSSHDVVAFIRRRLGVRKVGHTGTLDPLAAGVLLVCLGRSTRAARFLRDDKAYRAEFVLGVTTDSADAQGEILSVTPLDGLDEERLAAVLKRFTGPGMQVPPMTSARKVGGRKLYELARRGEEVPREPRPIEIQRLELVDIRGRDTPHPRVIVDVSCSAGTYIRTLCADIGKTLGCGAYMSFLLRTAVGPFEVGGARTLEEVGARAESGTLDEAVIPVEEALDHLPVVWVRPGAVRAVLSGRPLYPPGIAAAPERVGEYVRLNDEAGLLAVASPADRDAAPEQNVYRPQWVRDRT